MSNSGRTLITACHREREDNWCDDEGWIRIAGEINGLRDMIARVRNNDSLGGYICRNDENMLEENDNNTSGWR